MYKVSTVNSEEKTVPVKKGKNIFITSYACERRELDTQKISSYLEKNNYAIVSDPQEADYIILITCGATKSVSEISLKNVFSR